MRSISHANPAQEVPLRGCGSYGAIANLRDLHILRDDLLLRDLSLHNRLLILDLWDLRAKKSSTSVFLGSLYKVCKP